MQQLRIGEHLFPLGKRSYIMGILNVTPDSFSDGGRFNEVDSALDQARRMEREGADIIDVGGESTRPGHTPVDAQEELRRVIPVIEKLAAELRIPLSIDTSKAEVAEEALKAGASMVNDVWGGRGDPRMLEIVAESGAACCLMHNKEKAEYGNLVEEVLEALGDMAEEARRKGIPADTILLDPGIGFGKTVEHNIEIMRHLGRLRELPYPWLIGTSRKSLIGKTLDLPADERIEGTIVTTVLAIEAGCSFVRVHDVQANYRAARMSDRILRGLSDG